MKKYYCITVLALIVVTLLQVYNMSLQHKNYILNETDKINSVPLIPQHFDLTLFISS